MDLSHQRSPAHRGFTSLLSALSGVGVLWASPGTLPGASHLLPWSPSVPKHFLWRLHLPALAWLLFGASGVRLFALSHLGINMFYFIYLFMYFFFYEGLVDSTACNTLQTKCNGQMSMVAQNKQKIEYQLNGILVILLRTSDGRMDRWWIFVLHVI